jgi:hypothetical protein
MRRARPGAGPRWIDRPGVGCWAGQQIWQSIRQVLLLLRGIVRVRCRFRPLPIKLIGLLLRGCVDVLGAPARAIQYLKTIAI